MEGESGSVVTGSYKGIGLKINGGIAVRVYLPDLLLLLLALSICSAIMAHKASASSELRSLSSSSVWIAQYSEFLPPLLRWVLDLPPPELLFSLRP